MEKMEKAIKDLKEELVKAKYISKKPDGKGGYIYTYARDLKGRGNKKTEGKKEEETLIQKQISDKNPKAFFGYSDFHQNYKLYFYPGQITYKEFDTLDSGNSKNMEKYQISKGSHLYSNESSDIYFKTKEGLLQFIKDFNIKQMPIPDKEYEVKFNSGMNKKSIDRFYDKQSAEKMAEKLKKEYGNVEIKEKSPVLLKKI